MFAAICVEPSACHGLSVQGLRERLEAIAREFSPRIEVHAPHEISLDVGGLTRLFGDAQTIAQEMHRTATAHGVPVRVAVAGTRTAARLLAGRGRSASTAHVPLPAADCPQPTDDVADLPIESLLSIDATVDVATLRRWGLRTLGDLAALPASALAARLGQPGVRWQRLARGEDPQPLVPSAPDERFEQAMDLEWPIEGLEPLSFVLGRLIEPLSAHLERRGRGAAVLRVRLHLVRNQDGTKEIYERALELPAAMRDARTLRTLALLDLESHPPPAAIERVVVSVDPTPERIVQFSLLTRPLPSPEQISTLNARLAALMGERRCGSPAIVDSWRPGAFAMKPFAPVDSRDYGPQRQKGTEDPERAPAVALRRFRHPVPARVRVENDVPSRVYTDRRGLSGGRVEACAGPWRTSGAWWSEPWDRDEWDVTLGDGTTYRIFRERAGDRWFIDGVVD